MSSVPPPPPPPPPGGFQPSYQQPSYQQPGAYQQFPPSAPPGYQAYGMGAMANYAGFGSRLGAVLIDGLVMALINLPFEVFGIFGVAHSFSNCVSVTRSDGTSGLDCSNGAFQPSWMALGIAALVIGAIITTIIYCKKVSRGQSWGHKAVGIRIVDANTGQSISAGKVFVRQICRIFSGAVCYLGYLWMLWDPRKQTWHDKMVSTVVIKA